MAIGSILVFSQIPILACTIYRNNAWHIDNEYSASDPYKFSHKLTDRRDTWVLSVLFAISRTLFQAGDSGVLYCALPPAITTFEYLSTLKKQRVYIISRNSGDNILPHHCISTSSVRGRSIFWRSFVGADRFLRSRGVGALS